MPTVTIAVMIQDGSNQHHDESNFDFDDLLSKPDGSEVLASELVSMFNRLAPQVETDAQLMGYISFDLDYVARLSAQITQYKTVVRDLSAQIARQQGKIINLEAQLKLTQPPDQFEELGDKATAYCEVHGCKTVDLDTVRAWNPEPAQPPAPKPVKPGFEGLIRGKTNDPS